MGTEQERLLIYAARPTSLRQFIESWEPRYFYDNENERAKERLYTANIRGPHNEETLKELFRWKSFHTTAEKASRALKRKFFSKMAEVTELGRLNFSGHDALNKFGQDFLNNKFPDGGPIYRIFWLHCWYPDKFPIYDQNVHRAMVFIEAPMEVRQFNDEEKIKQYLDSNELTRHSHEEQIKQYLHRYVPFFEQFRIVASKLSFDQACDGIRGRKADRALVTFGDELKSKVFLRLIASPCPAVSIP